MHDERFTHEAALAGFAAEEYMGNTFVGVAVLCRDPDEVVRLSRSTSDPLWLEPLPAGGFLLFPRERLATLAELAK